MADTTKVWMPMYIGDLLADTMHLTSAEFGAYHYIMYHQWRNGAIPDRLLRAISRLSKDEWADSEATLKSFLSQDDQGDWYQKRTQREKERSDKLSDISRMNGLKGGRPSKSENNPAGYAQVIEIDGKIEEKLPSQANWAKNNPEEPRNNPAGYPAGYPDHNPEGTQSETPSPSQSPLQSKAKSKATSKTKTRAARERASLSETSIPETQTPEPEPGHPAEEAQNLPLVDIGPGVIRLSPSRVKYVTGGMPYYCAFQCSHDPNHGPIPPEPPPAKTLTADGLELPDSVSLEAWEDFLAMRKQIKFPLTARSAKMLIKDLQGWHDQGYDAQSIVEDSVKKSYRGFFLKPDTPRRKKPSVEPRDRIVLAIESNEKFQTCNSDWLAPDGTPWPELRHFTHDEQEFRADLLVTANLGWLGRDELWRAKNASWCVGEGKPYWDGDEEHLGHPDAKKWHLALGWNIPKRDYDDYRPDFGSDCASGDCGLDDDALFGPVNIPGDPVLSDDDIAMRLFGNCAVDGKWKH